MPIYTCSKCSCKENTALGHYWSKSRPENYMWDKSNEAYKGKALCSECGPKKYNDNTPTGFGKWHGKFPKQK